MEARRSRVTRSVIVCDAAGALDLRGTAPHAALRRHSLRDCFDRL